MGQMEKHIAVIRDVHFEYAIKGQDSPCILLINGAGGPLEGWSRIWKDIGDNNRVFAYNRPGIGKSSEPVAPQTGKVMVNDLRELLSTLDIQAPYLIVGHSLGGFIADLYARMYPDEVLGVVFMESATIRDASENVRKQNKSTKNQFSETENVLMTMKQIQESGPFPDIPVRVIIGSKPAFHWLIPSKIKENRLKNQQEFMLYSGKGKVRVAGRSGHFPQLTEPKLVIEEINDLLKVITAS